MPFLRSSTRPQAVECFFCLSPSLLPPSALDRKGKGRAEVGSKWNWRCERCGCWNIKDEKGEMVSNIPAMHNSSLNKASFSLRATPSSSRLPSISSSASSSSTFCHSCLANQTLIMNMLANYLPDDDDPTFTSLYTALPAYLANLHARYPPVCSSCQPAVDAALRKSDQRAQGEALGSALRRGASTKSDVSVSENAGPLAILVWKIRGVLFCAGTALSLGRALSSERLIHQNIPLPFEFASLPLPNLEFAFHLISILWIFWDPYWLRRVKSRDRAKVRGRKTWLRNMCIILVLRLLATIPWGWSTKILDPGMKKILRHGAAGTELALLLHALINLRISQPVPIQLVRPVASHSTLSSPVRSHISSLALGTISPAGLSALSLDHNPLQHTNPIFGQPSLQTHNKSDRVGDEPEPMDWEPSPAAALSNGGWTTKPPHWDPDDDADLDRPLKRSDWDGFGVGRQRIFPQPSRADETGLESLLAGWGLGGGQQPGQQTGQQTAQTSALSNPASNGVLVINETVLRRTMLILGIMRTLGALSSAAAVFLGHLRSFAVDALSWDSISRLDSILSAAEAAIGVLYLLIAHSKGTIFSTNATQAIITVISILLHGFTVFVPNSFLATTESTTLKLVIQCSKWIVWAFFDFGCWLAK